MLDDMKNTLKYHKFHSIYQQNQTRKNIRSLRISPQMVFQINI